MAANDRRSSACNYCIAVSPITARGVREKIVVGRRSVDVDRDDSLTNDQNAWRSRAPDQPDAVKALLHTSFPVSASDARLRKNRFD